MLMLALILPLVVGIAGIILLDPADRPRGFGRIGAVLRGYPYAAVLALVLLTMSDRGADSQGAEHPQGLDR